MARASFPAQHDVSYSRNQFGEIPEAAIQIASWNVNSIRARLDHVKAWLESRIPDVVLLQELKATDFPTLLFRELGYHTAFIGQKSYNGVAILSREPIQIVTTTLDGDNADSHARFLEVMVQGIRIVDIYAPNGNPIGSDKFLYKLAWMDRLLCQMSLWLQGGVPTLIGGDFNIIPEEIDCDKPANWIRDALFQSESRDRFRAMLSLGYVDAFRSLHPDAPGQYTYWDYFRQAFERNRGIRIDHFLLSPTLAPRLKGCEIDKTPRGWEKPSDHTPIVIHLDAL